MLATSRTHKLSGSGYGEGLGGSLKKAGERWHKDRQQQIHTRQNKCHSQSCNTIMTKQRGKPLKHSVNNERNRQIKQKGPCPSESHSSTSFSPFSLSCDYAAFQLHWKLELGMMSHPSSSLVLVQVGKTRRVALARLYQLTPIAIHIILNIQTPQQHVY